MLLTSSLDREACERDALNKNKMLLSRELALLFCLPLND